MELVDFRIFIALAENGSATKTAQHLRMTQPGVSQHLARLETEMGYKLFDRVGRGIVLNDAGRELLERARKIIADVDRLKEPETGAYCPIGNLHLGLTDSATMTVIPPALARFQKEYPGIHLQLDVNNSGEIEYGVLRGHYDIGITTSGSRVHPLLDTHILYHDRIDAIVSRNHVLGKRHRVSLQTLAEYPLLVYPRQSRTRQLIDDGFHSRGIHPKKMMDVYFNTGAARLAEAGLGVALLSQAFITGEMPKHKCVHLRIDGDPFSREICLIRKRDASLSDAARSFYEMVTQVKKVR